jgi:hypothetical protein
MDKVSLDTMLILCINVSGDGENDKRLKLGLKPTPTVKYG